MNNIQTLLRVAEIDPSVRSVDLHGMSVEEAKYQAELFVDQLFREGVRIGKIIHGKGEDILSRALPESLKKHKYIERIHTPAGTHETGSVIYVSILV